MRLSIIAAGLAAAAGQAAAADGSTCTGSAAAGHQTWTGFYIGGHLGGGVTDGDLRADYLSVVPGVPFGVNPTLARTSASGFLGGVRADTIGNLRRNGWLGSRVTFPGHA